MLRFRHKREASEETPRRRRRKPIVLAMLAGVGAWLFAKSHRSPEHAGETTEPSSG